MRLACFWNHANNGTNQHPAYLHGPHPLKTMKVGNSIERPWNPMIFGSADCEVTAQHLDPGNPSNLSSNDKGSTNPKDTRWTGIGPTDNLTYISPCGIMHVAACHALSKFQKPDLPPTPPSTGVRRSEVCRISLNYQGVIR